MSDQQLGTRIETGKKVDRTLINKEKATVKTVMCLIEYWDL